MDLQWYLIDELNILLALSHFGFGQLGRKHSFATARVVSQPGLAMFLDLVNHGLLDEARVLGGILLMVPLFEGAQE
jgi:hypothetical protein